MRSILEYSGEATIIYSLLLIYIVCSGIFISNFISKKTEKIDLTFLDIFTRFRKAMKFRNYLSKEGNYVSFEDPIHEENVLSLKIICISITIPISTIIFYKLLKLLFISFPFLNFLPNISNSFY